jgi:Glycosyl transferase family 2
MTPPRMSVLIPLQDERETGAECLRAWTGQDADPSCFELLVVALGEDPQLEAEARPLLRSSDRWLELPGGDEYEAFNHAAAQARGEFVLVTEAHCVPEADCMSAMLAELDRTGAPGVRGESVPVPVGPMGELEAEEFADALNIEREPGHWRKVLIHDTAIRRDLFTEHGGLPSAYGDFAPWVLAINLHSNGQRLVFSDRTRVRHTYDGDLEHVGEHVRSFGQGEMTYRSELSAANGDGKSIADAYLVHAEEWEQRLAHSRRGARLAMRAAAALRHPGGAAPAARHALTAVFGARPEIARARRASAHAGRVTERTSDRDERRDAFREFWRQTSRLGRLEGLNRAGFALPGPAAPEERIDLCSDLSGMGVGFHVVEGVEGEPVFRWTDSLALLQVNVPGPGPCTARFELRPLERPPGKEPNPRVAVDGRPVQSSYDDDSLSFPIEAGEHSVAFACKPLRPRRLGVDDERRLGLCVRALSFEQRSG